MQEALRRGLTDDELVAEVEDRFLNGQPEDFSKQQAQRVQDAISKSVRKGLAGFVGTAHDAAGVVQKVMKQLSDLTVLHDVEVTSDEDKYEVIVKAKINVRHEYIVMTLNIDGTP